MRAVLISTYEMGRQPFGLASPAAWLDRAGAHVTLCDLSRQPLPDEEIRRADFVGFYVPMHTATRMAVALLPRVQALNPEAFLCFYGLYAIVNEDYLRSLGVHGILGSEFEQDLTELAMPKGLPGMQELATLADLENLPPMPRLKFILPLRAGLPELKQYAHVVMPEGGHRVAGYTEASRGCKHLCRHCPIVPVYAGMFRIVQPDVVLADVRQQVAAGAQHITFGDPDFFNGPKHAMQIVEALHREFPSVSYDVTIKVEHLLNHADLLPRLRDTGCLFVTSAVESVDDTTLHFLGKGHTRADFIRAVGLLREASIAFQPTFVPFTPWTTLQGYADLLRVLAELDLAENVAPIQLAIRLLLPAGSLLMHLPNVQSVARRFDPAALAYPWKHPDRRVDALQKEVEAIVQASEKMKRSRARTFGLIWQATHAALAQAGAQPREENAMPVLASRATIPYLNEPWYC